MTQLDRKVTQFLWTLGAASNAIELIYLNGGCYRLYQLLKIAFPIAEPYYGNGGHVITKIGDKFYDILGEVTDQLSEYAPMTSTKQMCAENSSCNINIQDFDSTLWLTEEELIEEMLGDHNDYYLLPLE